MGEVPAEVNSISKRKYGASDEIRSTMEEMKVRTEAISEVEEVKLEEDGVEA